MSFSMGAEARAALLLLLACLLWGRIPTSVAAQAGPHHLRLEGGGAYSLRADDERDDFGGGFGVGYEYRALRALGLEARFSGYFLPFQTSQFRGSGLATYYAPSLGLRVHMAPGSERLDPWVAAAGTFVRTGPLNRGGLEAGVGLDIYLNEHFALGPFIRYGHIFQPNDDAAGGQDGRLLMAGLALTWVPARRAADAAEDEPSESAEGDDASVQDAGERGGESGGESGGDGEGDDNQGGDGGTRASDGSSGSATGAIDDDLGPSRPRDQSSDEARARARADARASRQEEVGGEVVLDATIRFGFRSWELTPETEAELAEVIATLRRERSVHVVLVVGHADQIGDQDVNQRISEVRAQAVARYLRRNGARHVRFIVRGVGDSEPLVGGDSPEALAPNRRVELQVVQQRGGQVR